MRYFLIGFFLGLAVGFVVTWCVRKRLSSSGELPDTLVYTDSTLAITTVTDTVTYRVPVHVDSLVIRYDTVHVNMNSALRISDDSVVVPIAQKVYADSGYRAYVSGFNAALDSLSVFPQTVYVTKTISKKKRWSFGFSAGIGITPKGVLPYAGGGVNLNF